jgi:hypothetical protein
MGEKHREAGFCFRKQPEFAGTFPETIRLFIKERSVSGKALKLGCFALREYLSS